MKTGPDALNILTLNTQGLNSPHKRTKRSKTVCKRPILPPDLPLIILFKPTHKYIWHHITPKVLIAFHCSTPFTPLAEINDPEGHYLILSGMLLDTEMTVVSYYAPNSKHSFAIYWMLLMLIKWAPCSSVGTPTSPYTPSPVV